MLNLPLIPMIWCFKGRAEDLCKFEYVESFLQLFMNDSGGIKLIII